MARPFQCPYESCGSTNTVSKGVRRTKTMGARRIRRCKDCGRKFTPRQQAASEADEKSADLPVLPGVYE